MRTFLSVALLSASFVYGAALTGIRNHWSDPYDLRPNPLYPYIRSRASRSPGNMSNSAPRLWRGKKDSDVSPSRTRTRTRRSKLQARPLRFRRRDASRTTERDLDTRPTPEPTGEPSVSTTVFISDEGDFALLLPARPGELISEAEQDAISFCTPGSSSDLCRNRMPDGFITAASLAYADDKTWIQVTGCIDSSKFYLDPSDTGGQMDVRFPNGAQCTFGGWKASFIELVEPALNRFCIRCCSTPDDQINCNSHKDRSGCENAIPGTYDFPELGISCA